MTLGLQAMLSTLSCVPVQEAPSDLHKVPQGWQQAWGILIFKTEETRI